MIIDNNTHIFIYKGMRESPKIGAETQTPLPA